MKNFSRKNILLFNLIIPLLLSTYSSSYPQDQEKNHTRKTDSTFRYQGIIPPVEFQYDLDEIFNTPLNNNIPEEVLFDSNQSTIWLRTELMVSQSFSKPESGRFSPHFTSTLYEKYLEDSEFDMVRYVLGVAQTSAVAYMAYRHIKKYGFWK